MKRLFCAFLALTLVLALAACGKKQAEAPDLNAYFTGQQEKYGEDNFPALMDLTQDETAMEMYYPGLKDYELKQSVIQMPMIKAVPFELALVECAKESDVEAVKGILQARIDYQIENGAFYPMTLEGWEKAELIVNGNVVALIVGSDMQADMVSDFNALF